MRPMSTHLVAALAAIALATGAQATGDPHPEPGEGRIGNFVWHDLDEDGVQDDGEPGIPGVHVRHLLL